MDIKPSKFPLHASMLSNAYKTVCIVGKLAERFRHKVKCAGLKIKCRNKVYCPILAFDINFLKMNFLLQLQITHCPGCPNLSRFYCSSLLILDWVHDWLISAFTWCNKKQNWIWICTYVTLNPQLGSLFSNLNRKL